LRFGHWRQRSGGLKAEWIDRLGGIGAFASLQADIAFRRIVFKLAGFVAGAVEGAAERRGSGE
jgi:hypothetical protein